MKPFHGYVQEQVQNGTTVLVETAAPPAHAVTGVLGAEGLWPPGVGSANARPIGPDGSFAGTYGRY